MTTHDMQTMSNEAMLEMREMTTTVEMNPVLLPEVRREVLRLLDGEVVRRVDLTPAQATAMMDRWQYQGQRKIRDSRVRAYVSMMERGEWQERTEFHVGVLPDGTHRLMNGYHRLHALARMSPEIEFALPVRIIYTERESEGQLASGYGVIDQHGARSYNDALFAANLHEEWGISFDVIRSASAAGALILGEFTPSRSNSADAAKGRSTPGRVQFVREWEEEIRLAATIFPQATSRLVRQALRRQSVMSVMLVTLRYQTEKAIEFWTQVATGEELKRGSGSKALLDYILNNQTKSSHEHIYARYVANAWNAWRQGKEIIRPQVMRSGFTDPIVIEGTPFSRTNRLRAYRERMIREQITQSRRKKTAVKNTEPAYIEEDLEA